jgi:2-dehydro-3-deoxy-L-rhamnonate dehydrogenase (NAD+)
MTNQKSGATPQVIAIIGAGSGIGRASALYLAGSGHYIGCYDRDAASADVTAAMIIKAGGQALSAGLDITDKPATDDAISALRQKMGAIDALVNCAGITGRTNLKAHEVDLDEFDAVYRINMRAALIVSQAVLPMMLARGYGRILHVASIAGKDGNAGMTAYSATKAGLIGMVKSMGKDYAESGITINALAPAVILTPMVEALPQATVDYMTAKIPMRRCGTLEEAAAMIAWIVSPACSFTTGFTFDLSGGRATY